MNVDVDIDVNVDVYVEVDVYVGVYVYTGVYVYWWGVDFPAVSFPQYFNTFELN